MIQMVCDGCGKAITLRRVRHNPETIRTPEGMGDKDWLTKWSSSKSDAHDVCSKECATIVDAQEGKVKTAEA